MEKRSIYKNISPLDHRYYLSNKELYRELGKYLSEEAAVTYCTLVETALLKTHIHFFLNGETDLLNAAERMQEKVTCDDVYREEEKTQHNIRALVNVIKRYLPEKLQPYVHLGATSVDILDTAMSLRVRDAVKKVILPLSVSVLEQLVTLTETYAETAQIGRTHGQHAVPVTAGFAFAEYTARIGKSIQTLDRLVKELRGQLSGAVGAYNAMSLMVPDPFVFEHQFCSYLTIQPSEYSNQLMEPEYLLRLLLEMNVTFGIIANLADDLRNLQRTEIGELRESFSDEQVGSSTMPQKRNPWNSEHIKSLWKTFAPRVITFYMDQISEHQRDLTNSASSRFVADYLVGYTAAMARLKKVLSNLSIDSKRMRANLSVTGDLPLSEAAYIILSAAGKQNSHETIKQITLECEKTGERLIDQLKKRPDLWRTIDNHLHQSVGLRAEDLFSKPDLYRGKAAEKAKVIAEKYGKIAFELKESLS